MRIAVAVVVLAATIGLGSCSSSSDPDPGPGPGPATVEFRPILSQPRACDLDAEEDPATTVPIEEPERPEAGCQAVGPAAFDGTSLASAEAIQGGAAGEAWGVAVEVRAADQATVDDLYDTCRSTLPTCPTGEVAVVVDGTIVSVSWVVRAVDGPFVIPGLGPEGFSQDEAEALADRIRR